MLGKNTFVIVYLCHTLDFIVIIISICILLEKNIFVGTKLIDLSSKTLFMKTHILYENINLREEVNLFDVLKEHNAHRY